MIKNHLRDKHNEYLTNFTIIGDYETRCRSKNSFKCNFCSHITKCRTDKLKDGLVNCKCGNNETINMEELRHVYETFKPIPGSSIYRVNNKGVVASTKGTLKYLLPQRKKSGYLRVNIHGRKECVHQLVLLAFVGPKPSKYHVCRHLNDIPDDNRLENLCWDIQKLNMKDIQTNTDKRKSIIKKMYLGGYSSDDICLISGIPLDIVKELVSGQ